jgi:hypothetical protein
MGTASAIVSLASAQTLAFSSEASLDLVVVAVSVSINGDDSFFTNFCSFSKDILLACLRMLVVQWIVGCVLFVVRLAWM